MKGSTVARILVAGASMMFAAGAAAQLPPQIGSFQTMLVEYPSIFPTSISIINPNTGQDLVDVTISVTLPAGLTGQFAYFAAPQPPATQNCSGNIAAGPDSATVTGGVIPAATQCTLVVYHQSAAVGFYDNIDVAITSSANPVTPVTTTPPSLAAEPIVVHAMPTSAVSFSPDRIAPGGLSTLSFTFANPDPNFTVNFNTVQTIGLGTLVAGATFVEEPPSCASGEGPPFIDAGNFLNIYYGTLLPGSTCIVSVEVTGPALGAGSISEGHPVPDQPSGNFTPDLHYSGPLSPITYNVYPMPVTVPQAALTVVGPELGVSGLPVTFPNTLVGTPSSPVIAIVTNTGLEPLTISAFSISGNYTYGTDCPVQSPMAPGASCSVSLTFLPLITGVNDGSLSISSDGGNATITLDAAGMYLWPTVSLYASPATIVAGSPATIEVSIRNDTGVPYDGTGFTYTLTSGLVVAPVPNGVSPAGPCAGVLVPPTPGSASISVSGLSVPPLGSCSFLVDVTSATPGTYILAMPPGVIVGTVANETNVTTNNFVTATLTVDPAVPGASVSPASLTFADQRVGTASASQAGTLTSTGTATLTIASIATTGDFAHTTTCGPTLAAGSSCAIDVAFTPTAAGARTGTLTITDDAMGSPRSVSLSGNGVAPVLSVSPMTVVFPGSTTIGATSAPIPVTVTNTGGAPLSFSGTIVATGEFNVASSCPLPPSTLAPSASCSLVVTFAPGASGTRNGTIPITSDGGSALVDLGGVGGLTLPAVTWNFNPLAVIAGSPSTLQLQINNANGAPFDSPGFTYDLPSGLVAASSNFGYSASPCLGTLTQPAPGDTSFSVSGLSVPTFGACAYTIEVTSATPGTYNVQMAPGTIAGSVLLQSGVGNAASNTASLTVTAAPAPVLSISPAPPGPLGFGNVTVGSVSAIRTVALTNAGNAALTFSGPPAVTGAFTVNTATATPCPVSPATLPASPGPGNSCTVDVQFAPTAVGPASGTLAFASDGGSVSLDLAGTGDPVPVPVVSLSPTSLTFAAQAVGTVSGAQVVLLDNVGMAPLAIPSITTGGDFAHSSSCPVAPSTLPAGFGCDVSVTFSPLLSGGRTGAVTITSNAAGSPHLVSLSGMGTLVAVPAVTVAPTSLSFPQTQIGTPSAPASVRVTNSGTAPLLVSVVRIVGGGFGIASDGCTGTMAAGAGCDVTVVFTPPVDSSLAATLEIASNAPDSPAVVPLSGRGTHAPLATLSVSPGSLAFAEQTIGSASHAQTVTLANTGTATATVSGFTVTGDYAQTNNCASVPADGSCTIGVTFTPTVSGPRPGSIVISANASNAPITVALSGSGVPPPLPVIELSVSSLSYGNTMIGRGAAGQAFTLRNAGGVPLTITGMSVPAEFPVSSGCHAVVPAGESCRIDVGFLPKVPGPRAGRLDITSNASNGTKGVDLSGAGCRFTFLGRNPALICQ